MGVKRWFARTPRAELTEALGEAHIPSFKVNVMRLLKQLRDDTSTLATIARTAEADPGLTVRILRTVNSPAYGLRRKVDSVQHAISLLGRSELETLTLAMAVRGAIPKSEHGDRKFWQLAARRAGMARNLAQRIEPSVASLSFSAGLLQDLAIPLLAQARPSYRELLSDVKGGEETVFAERAAYGFDHPQVAGWLCECWGFPEALQTAISGHHSHREAPGTRAPRRDDRQHQRLGARPDRRAGPRAVRSCHRRRQGSRRDGTSRGRCPRESAGCTLIQPNVPRSRNSTAIPFQAMAGQDGETPCRREASSCQIRHLVGLSA